MKLSKVLFVTLTLCAPIAQAQNCTTISSLPYLISQPGRYCLGNHLTASGGGLQIPISASFVELDLAGFELKCTASQNGIFTAVAANVSLSHLTIKNGIVSGCNFAVSLKRCNSCVIEDLRLTGNSVGIHISGDAARVHSNSIYNAASNQGAPALMVESNMSLVEGNLIAGSAQGVVNAGKGNVLRHNSFGNCGTAIRFDLAATYQNNLTQGCGTSFTGAALAASKDAGGNL